VIRVPPHPRSSHLRCWCVQVNQVVGCFVLQSDSVNTANLVTTSSVVNGLFNRRNVTIMVVTSLANCHHVLAFYGRLSWILATMWTELSTALFLLFQSFQRPWHRYDKHRYSAL